MALRGGSPQHTGSAIRRGTESPRRARPPCGPRLSRKLCLSHDRRASLRNAPMPHAWFATRSCREGVPKLVHTPCGLSMSPHRQGQGLHPWKGLPNGRNGPWSSGKATSISVPPSPRYGILMGKRYTRPRIPGVRTGRVRAVGFARRPVSARWRGDVRPIWRSLNQWAHVLESGRPVGGHTSWNSRRLYDREWSPHPCAA
jgi:hypothetical protein